MNEGASKDFSDQQRAVYFRLKDLRNAMLKADYSLGGLIFTNGELALIAQHMPTTLDQLRAIPDIDRGRVERWGELFVAEIAGKSPPRRPSPKRAEVEQALGGRTASGGCEPPQAQDTHDAAPADDSDAGTTAEGTTPSAEPPGCPEHGVPMVKRKARTGPNAGGEFWGCPKYPECKVTLASGEHADVGLEGGNVMERRPMVARPMRKGLDSTYFEYLTVSESDLSERLAEAEAGMPQVGLHWRCEHPKPQRLSKRSKNVRRALAVMEKLVAKGSITLLSPELEQSLSTSPARGVLAPSWGDCFDEADWEDSEAERRFCCKLLAPALGRGWQRWVIPQVDLGTLVDDPDVAESEQRVDFLVCHPNLSRPIVVEIDGAPWHRNKVVDESRTKLLRRNRYSVVRIDAAEIAAGRGPKLDRLLHDLSIAGAGAAGEAPWVSPFRRAGQLQRTLLHCVITGLLDPDSDNEVAVATDLVDFGEMTAEQFSAVIQDFEDLARRVGRLYGVSLFRGGIAALESSGQAVAEVAVSFYGAARGECEVHVDDVFLPFPITRPSQVVEPGLPSNWRQDDLEYFVRRIFRKPGFWEGQCEAIDRALKGEDTIVLLPTGAGKSIAFQLASLLVPGPAIVVEPIRSLMHDQVENLKANYGIDRAVGITSEIGTPAKRRVYELLVRGEFLFAYVAPERFQIEEFRDTLLDMSTSSPVGLIVIDEAHCVSEWGHDFRTSYLRIGESSRKFCENAHGKPPLLALTGTASYAVLKDLQRELRVEDPKAVITPASFDRPNLHFESVQCGSLEKPDELRRILSEEVPRSLGVPEADFLSGQANGGLPGLVFCPFVNGDFGTTKVRETLAGMGLRCEVYSGRAPKNFDRSDGGWNKHKREVSRRFKQDDLQVLACTKAFGMGIDKPNVRFTVHYCMPASIESFYQEAGRAGRDKQPSFCYVLSSQEYIRDHPDLLSMNMTIEQVSQARREVPRKSQDDVLRLLFFQENAFKGIDHELEILRAVLLQWMSASGEDRAKGMLPLKSVEIGMTDATPPAVDARARDEAFAQTERALHRLLVLGVVDDYSAVYKDRSFKVHPTMAEPEAMIDSYVRYVGSYQGGRRESERAKANEFSQKNRATFILELARLYVEFVYDVIEKGRRQAMDTMRQACLTEAGEAFRQKILDYLTHTEFSERLEEMSSDIGAGLSLTEGLLRDAEDPGDAGRLRGQTARYLESYPDHPGLLLLRGLSEARCTDSLPEVVRDNVDGFLANAGTRYSLPADDVAGGVVVGVDTLRPVDRPNANRLEAVSVRVDGYRDGDIARRVIARMGVDDCQTVAWNLLLADAHAALAAVNRGAAKTRRGRRA